jgi:hypothetical protein
LFGRRINCAENQLAFVQHLRWIVDDDLNPEEAVRSYHSELARQGIRPIRTLEDDLIRSPAALARNRYAHSRVGDA